MKETAVEIHKAAIIIDAVCPLLDNQEHIAEYRVGGLTTIAPTVGYWEGAAKTLRTIGSWHKLLREREDMLLVRSAADIRVAKVQGKLGIILHFQGPNPIEDNLDLIDAYKALGVGVMQLAYNVKNRIGDGCEERTNAGLSRFGLQVVERMNKVRMIVDCSHTGVRTTLDAIEHSSAPVIISHANAKSVFPSPRNLSDDLIKAIAGNGGTIGMVGFPGFVSRDKRPSLDQFIDHITYVAELVGIEHVTLGIDYYSGQYPYVDDAVALKEYRRFVDDNQWSPEVYPQPPHFFPAGIETPKTMLALTEALVRRGFTDSDIRKVYGENLLRIYETIWGS
ncbi:dipeptidase [Brucella anthropi]|uniref:dipeptidase n=1 Tax=Brucella anthropi TaxID=529 RepID=UPI002165F86C|nr:dipeptidase [Brucella anthropi]MDG9793482.1 dipeptidase [Brucella anthropi]MDH0583269.1 dipeptidase [Brucella anthropi]MDH0819883.1 dipeptidase [Brucella anthropi]MDH2086592.1 dipeptidase [Brucella anthropi]UVV70867.1 dipeptidase [Brucella anthropi]